ncbi:MAG: DNA replication protein [Variibacter sp.]|nr:DNA replication protein [Variibacter sp.]
MEVTATGRAHLARLAAARQAGRDGALDPFRAQHLEEVPATEVATAIGAELAVEAGGAVRANAAESPLAWLARRKGRDGAPLISPAQLQAGERLRAEFTRAQLMPRVTANWAAAVAQSRRGGGNAAANLTESVVAARQRLRRALEAVGPEFSGLLLDVCCFLKGLDDVERERCWPARSAKVVLQLGLDRLARHYGLTSEARGRASAPLRAWSAAGEEAAAADGL